MNEVIPTEPLVITPEELEAAALPSPATEHASVEQLDAALVAGGIVPSQATIAAESLIDSKARFTDNAKPTADTINAIMDIHDETRQLAANELERAMGLQTSVDRLNTDLSDAKERISRLEAGIRHIAGCLQEEAENREWCSEYNDFVDNVNRHLSDDCPKLTKSRQPHRIHFTATLTAEEAHDLESKIDRLLSNDFNTGYCELYEYEEA